MAIRELNNDSKPDVVIGDYFTGKTSFYLNNSTLSNTSFGSYDDFNFYPVPFKEILQWTKTDTDLYKISIYNEAGKLDYSNKRIATSFLDLTFLPNGVYIANLKLGTKSYSRKVIKN